MAAWQGRKPTPRLRDLEEMIEMFVNVVQFPPIKPSKDEPFREWFRESNTAYQDFEGFISRRLLSPVEPGRAYAAIVEHESRETFMAMHNSTQRQDLWAKVEPLLEGRPSPSFYEVIEAVTARPR